MPVYGRQLFDQVPTTFAPISEAPVPSDYVIGPGDELMIRIWGKIDLDTHVTVDRNGQFFLPRIGALNVAGLHYSQLQSYIQAAVGNLYKDFNLNVTMGHLRSIQIFVLGSARQPGVYTVGSLSTLVDALFASGGPSATGSMRRIELRRRGQLMTVFDIYRLLRNGDKSHDVPLLSLNDNPGNMVGPEAEKTALVRHCCRTYLIGANLTVPTFFVMTRKSYGLGKLAMTGGSMRLGVFAIAWPTGEFGGMGLEGQVKLGRRKELAAIADPAERLAAYEGMVAELYERGKALNAGSLFEVDEVIDPADTRKWIVAGLRSMPPTPQREGKKRPCVDGW